MPSTALVPSPLVCDLHCDTLLEIEDGASFASNPAGHGDIPQLRAGRVGLQVFACFAPSGLAAARAHQEANALLDVPAVECARHADDVQLAQDARGVDAAVAAGKIAVLPAVENGHAIAGDLRNLELFRARGVRYTTLTHARHIEWTASCGED